MRPATLNAVAACVRLLCSFRGLEKRAMASAAVAAALEAWWVGVHAALPDALQLGAAAVQVGLQAAEIFGGKILAGFWRLIHSSWARQMVLGATQEWRPYPHSSLTTNRGEARPACSLIAKLYVRQPCL